MELGAISRIIDRVSINVWIASAICAGIRCVSGMARELENFLRNVWANKAWILYGEVDNPVKVDPVDVEAVARLRDDFVHRGRSVADHVYALYAPEYGVQNAGISEDVYRSQITAIIPPRMSRWGYVMEKAGFRFWHNRGAHGPEQYRIYLNPKLPDAAKVFQILLGCAELTDIDLARARLYLPYATPLPVPYLRLHSAKIANEKEAFSGRHDIIVAYITGDRATTQTLLRDHFLPAFRHFGLTFNNDIPPMTEQVTWGVSIAPEPQGEANSFGGLRCDLIAKALVRCVTGTHRPLDSPDPWPLQKVRTAVRTANPLEFAAEVRFNSKVLS